MKINRNKWQTDFEKELDKAERRQLSSVKSYYKNEYAKGINSFLAEGQTNFQLLFQESDLSKIYRNLYTDIGLQFAKWYAKSYDKYLQKGENPLKYATQWENTFASFGSAVGAQRVTLVSGTAKQTLIKITQNLMRDPDFMSVGNAEKGRILKSQFNKYSSYQAERLVRTEATNAANFATMESATTIFPGAKMQKEWIASFDDRTRDTHAEVGASEPIPYNDAFMVGGNFLMYPGDPSGPAAEVVNCRCSVAPFPVTGAQTVGEITDINFGLGGAQSTGFGLGDVASAINATLSTVNSNNNITFVPAKSLQEAEERMLKFANNVDFKGLTLSKQNEILNALEDILGKYNSKVKVDIGFQKVKRSSWGIAGYRLENGIPSNPQYLRIQKTYSKSAQKLSKKQTEIFLSNKQDRLKKWQDILDRPDLNPERSEYYRNKIQILNSTKRWTIEGQNSLYTTTAHESFHVVDYTYGARNIFSEQLIKNNIVRNEWYQVSEYGGSSIGELWAEVGTAIQTNTNIPSGFIKAFEDTLKIIGAI
tara:strand:- start:2357 stop:3964 length:1608 start_codon:yes stop_codon:yes gene_type:complete